MPDTFQALGVLMLAVLPGGLYTWALEREAGNWGIGVSDRILRFVGVSVIFQAAFAYPLYVAWSSALSSTTDRRLGALLASATPPWWTWLIPIAYVALPIGVGTIAGLSVHRWPRTSRILVGRDPAPRAWDHLFSPNPAGLVRAQLLDGRWVGGLFAERSYAAGYPEEPQDIYIQEVWEIGEDGRFIGALRDETFEAHGALIRWGQVKVLEFLHLPKESRG